MTRCCNNYGPYQYPEKVIPLFITSLLDGGRVPLYGDGGNVREWVHVDDHCRGIELAARRGVPGRVYHIGGGVELVNKDLTSALLEACGAGWESVDYVAGPQGPRPQVQPGRLGAAGPGVRAGRCRSLTGCETRSAGTRPTGPGGSRSPLSRADDPLAGHRRRRDARPDLVSQLHASGAAVTGLTRGQLDITDPAAVRQ